MICQLIALERLDAQWRVPAFPRQGFHQRNPLLAVHDMQGLALQSGSHTTRLKLSEHLVACEINSLVLQRPVLPFGDFPRALPGRIVDVECRLRRAIFNHLPRTRRETIHEIPSDHWKMRHLRNTAVGVVK